MAKNRIEFPEIITQAENIENLAPENTGASEAANANPNGGEPLQGTQAQNENEATKSTGETESEAKKETRGRKPLTEEEKAARKAEKEKAKQGESGTGAGATGSGDTKDAKNDLLSDLSKYKTVNNGNGTQTQQAPQNEVKIDMSKFVSGALLLIVMDAILPGVICLALSFADRKYKYLDKRKVRLTREEKEELEPFADEVVKVIFLKVNPVIGFFVVSGILYGSKFMFLDETDFNLPPKKELNNGNKKPGAKK